MKNVTISATQPNDCGNSSLFFSVSNGIKVNETKELPVGDIAAIAGVPCSEKVKAAIKAEILAVTTLQPGRQSGIDDGGYLPVSLIRHGHGWNWDASTVKTSRLSELINAAKAAKIALRQVIDAAKDAYENDVDKITGEGISENFPVSVFRSSRR